MQVVRRGHEHCVDGFFLLQHVAEIDMAGAAEVRCLRRVVLLDPSFDALIRTRCAKAHADGKHRAFRDFHAHYFGLHDRGVAVRRERVVPGTFATEGGGAMTALALARKVAEQQSAAAIGHQIAVLSCDDSAGVAGCFD